MIPAWFIVGFLIVTFNYNLPYLLDPEFRYISKYRYFEWFVWQWLGRMVVGAILVKLYYVGFGDVVKEYSGEKILLVLVLAILNYRWTRYEIRRDSNRLDDFFN